MKDRVMIIDGREYRLVRVAGAGSRKLLFDVFVKRVPIGRELDLEACKSLAREHAKKQRTLKHRSRGAAK